jgi:hypothetical protein
MDALAICRQPGEPVEYLEARRATFGAGYGADVPLGRLVQALPPLADAPLENAAEFRDGGALALVRRGAVNFVVKARAAQAAGAAGLVVLNTEEENFVPNAPEGDDAADVTIPVLCVSADCEERLLQLLLGNDGHSCCGLLFSAANLRKAIEAGDEGTAHLAILGGQAGASRWSGAAPPPPGSFDPLVWTAELPCRGGAGSTYTSRASPPLFVASYLGHEAIVRLLLATLPALEGFEMAGAQQQRVTEMLGAQQAAVLLQPLQPEFEPPTRSHEPTGEGRSDAPIFRPKINVVVEV